MACSSPGKKHYILTRSLQTGATQLENVSNTKMLFPVFSDCNRGLFYGYVCKLGQADLFDLDSLAENLSSRTFKERESYPPNFRVIVGFLKKVPENKHLGAFM